MSLPIPYVWHVTGLATLSNGSPFSQGIIRAFDVLNNEERQLGETGFDQSGQFIITYSSSNFQMGDVNRTAPNLLLRIYDYQNRILWQSQIITNADSEQILNAVLDGSSSDDIWVVSGNVKDSNGNPLTSGVVIVQDKLDSQTFELGRSSLDTNGFYSVSFYKDCFQRGDTSRQSPNLVIVVQDSQSNTLTTVEHGSMASQNVNIPITVPSQPDQPEDTNKVFGTAVNRLGYALSGKKVKASCLDFKSPQGFRIISLGTATTDSKGAYSITYDPTQLPNTSTPTDFHSNATGNAIYAELQYYIKASDGTEVEMYTSSSLILHAATPQQIDFTFDEEASSSDSEYVDLNAVLDKYAIALLQEPLMHFVEGSMEGVAYTDAEKFETFIESTTRFSYVVDREGIEENKVRSYFLARKITSEFTKSFADAGYVAGSYTEYFYGLVRNNSETERSELLNLQPTEIHDRLLTAVSSGYISSKSDIESFLTIWKKVSSGIDRFETDTDFGMYHMLVLVLHGTLDSKDPPTTDQKTRIQNLLGMYFDASSDNRVFLNLVKPQSSTSTDPMNETEWKKLEYLLDLCDFSENNYDFVIAAYQYCEGLTSGPRSLKDMTGLKESDWTQIVKKTSEQYCQHSGAKTDSLPPEFPGATPSEQQAIYALKLSKDIITWFGQHSIALDLPDQIKAQTSGSTSPDPKWQAVSDFLKGDGKDYDLDNTHLETYMAEHPDISISDTVQDGLQAIQRLYRLTTDVKAIAYLLSLNPPLDAANLIAQYDEDQFLADHCVGLGGMDKARQIYRIAVNYTSELTNQVAKYHSSLNLQGESAMAVPRGLTAAPRIASLAGVNTTIAKPRTPARIVPNWTNLFGILNQQTATRGQSILSPSAYFVDLLEYLRGTSLNSLRSRRPDLLELELTKENAETALPTIDLVIEILEALAAKQPLPFQQTTMETVDLRAEPQYPNTFPDAYENLSNSFYPSNLPINFPREQARLLLEKCDLSWKHLAIALDKNSRRILIVDSGLSDALNGSKPVWELWGLDELNNSLLRPDKATQENGSWDKILSVASIFLDRSGLTMQEFLDLLSTRTFNSYEIKIVSDGEGIQEGDINRFSINGITSDFAITVSRFLRLQRLLGWTLAEMDEAWGLSLDDLDVVQDLHLSLGVPVLEVLAWAQNLQDELFAKTFKPAGSDDSLSTVYNIIFSGKGVALEKDTFSRWMCARLKFSSAEFDLVLDYLEIKDEHPTWGKQNLEDMYRIQSFARKLKLSITDFLKLSVWLDLRSGSDGWTWTGCREFSEKLQLLNSTSIPKSTWIQLAFPPESSVIIEANKFLKTLGSSLDNLRNQYKISDYMPLTPLSDLDLIITALYRAIEILKIEGGDIIEVLIQKTPPAEDSDAIADLMTWLNKLKALNFINDQTIVEIQNAIKAQNPGAELWSLFNALLGCVEKVENDALEAEIKTQLVTQFAITEEVCTDLLSKWLYSVDTSKKQAFDDWKTLTSTSKNFDTRPFCLFSKAASLVQALEIETAEALSHWMPGDMHPFISGWNTFSYDSNTYTQWDLLCPLIQMVLVVESLGYQEEGFEGLDDQKLLETRLDLRSNDLVALLSECNIISSSSEIMLSNIENWTRFLPVLELFRKSNTYPDTLKALLQPVENTDMATYTGQVNILHNCLMASMAPDEWRDFVQPINDGLRSRKRDALVAYVCWKSQRDAYYPQEFFDSNDLYAYYLIDVEMEPDMSVSRISQALLSIQQFVQRGLMGLEGRFFLTDRQKEQWEWMKNYRVWEANRKVFLYAENWIEPELRDDKSPFFKELEDKIIQSDDNSDYPEEAVSEYIDKLREVSNLDIVGACKEIKDGKSGDYTLHVVGRTRSTPHTFYYRRYQGKAIYNGEWTPWERIDAEISSLIVVPAMLDKRLYLVWPQYVQNQEQSNSSSGQTMTTGSTDQTRKTEIRMEWIHFDGKRWSGKKTSKTMLPDYTAYGAHHNLDSNETIGDRYHYQAQEISSNCLKINILQTWYDWETTTRLKSVQVTSETSALQSKSARSEKDSQYIGMYGYFKIWADGRDESGRYSPIENGIKQIPIIDKEIDVDIVRLFKTVIDDIKNNKPFTNLIENYKFIEKSISDLRTSVKNYAPSRFKLIHNFWVDDSISRSGFLEPLTFPNNNVILNQTPDLVRLMPVNFSFLSPINDVLSRQTPDLIRKMFEALFTFLPEEMVTFFLMDSSNTYMVKPISKISGTKQVFSFDIMSHPLANTFHAYLKSGGLKKLYTREIQALPRTADYTCCSGDSSVYLGYYIAGDWHAWDVGQHLFSSQFLPQNVSSPFPVPLVDFTWGSANGIYNWELFFHIPMLLAGKLSQQQRFQEAMDWYHLVFDPRIDLSNYERTKRWAQVLPKGARFWKFLPFFANKDADASISETLGMPTEENSLPDHAALKSLINKWKNDPFNPHLIARNRPVAYQKNVVMKYLDNLIAWADQLFMTDTAESINEAVQLYILAANILGPRSAEVPEMIDKAPWTAHDILRSKADDLGNVLINLENQLLTTNADIRNVTHDQASAQADQMLSLTGSMFYFSIPRNDKLMEYWDTVADRLYKIRNSLNYDGVKRALALYAPPIDPGLLVRAKAANLDVGAVLSGANAPMPYYRFQIMLQKAVEIARDTQGLGSTLLSALEKKDGEALSLLRTKHEEDLLKLNHSVRMLQIDEANAQLDTLQKNKETTEARQKFYQEIAKVSTLEGAHISMVGAADALNVAASTASLAGSTAAMIPDFFAGAVANAFGGPSCESKVSGGEMISKVSSLISQDLQIRAQIAHSAANLVQTNAGYERRWADWKLQETLATKELASIDKQMVAAEIRIQVAEKELTNLEKQIEQVDEVYTFMKTRFSNQELYNWLATQLNLLYTASYKLALDVAKRAEQCYRFELGLDNQNSPAIIQTNNWEGSRKGLLAGERLLADLRRLETSYMEKNRREMEITKPVSLALLNSSALRDLQNKGTCQIDIPEVLFDLDFPGHYFRRIKAVRLEIPCTAGPYTSVSAKLTLLKNRLRTTATLTDNEYNSNDGKNFVDNRVGIQSIATSQAQNDAGVFEFNFHDERYLPFEGAGAVSTWRLELPDTYRQFDYSSIADVVLHVSYTAREGGERLKQAAKEAISNALDTYEAIKSLPGLLTEIRLERDFNDNLQQLRSGIATTIQIDERRFPAFVNGNGKLKGVRFFAYSLEGKPINDLKLNVSLTDTSSNVKVFDQTKPWNQTEDDTEELSITGSWKLEPNNTTDSLKTLASLGDLVIELRYFI